MLIAIWNVRGMRKPHKQTAVTDFCISNNIDLFGILESKFKSSTFNRFFEKKIRIGISVTTLISINLVVLC